MFRLTDATTSGGVRRRVGKVIQKVIGEVGTMTGRRSRKASRLDLAPPPVGARRSSSKALAVTFTAPPDNLMEGCFERPTPLLLVAGEGQPASWWNGTASFLTSRGCTVGTMALSGRGGSSTDKLGLRALQAGVAAAVDKSGVTPPVMIAHSMAGFICQQYLQSYSASGLVLLDSFPPNPSALANEHLALALAGDTQHSDGPTMTTGGLSLQDLALLVKDEPARYEALLWRYFSQLHDKAPWQSLPRPHNGVAGGCPEALTAEASPFPAKAFAQMCLDMPLATLRLERHVVDTLVLGSNSATDDVNAVGMDMVKRDGFDAICEFHGAERWGLVDSQGLVKGTASAVPWHEIVWEWYDARF